LAGGCSGVFGRRVQDGSVGVEAQVGDAKAAQRGRGGKARAALEKGTA
jgi:hypothetical protein